jgi:hypothetical protein
VVRSGDAEVGCCARWSVAAWRVWAAWVGSVSLPSPLQFRQRRAGSGCVRRCPGVKVQWSDLGGPVPRQLPASLMASLPARLPRSTWHGVGRGGGGAQGAVWEVEWAQQLLLPPLARFGGNGSWHAWRWCVNADGAWGRRGEVWA